MNILSQQLIKIAMKLEASTKPQYDQQTSEKLEKLGFEKVGDQYQLDTDNFIIVALGNQSARAVGTQPVIIKVKPNTEFAPDEFILEGKDVIETLKQLGYKF